MRRSNLVMLTHVYQHTKLFYEVPGLYYVLRLLCLLLSKLPFFVALPKGSHSDLNQVWKRRRKELFSSWSARNVEKKRWIPSKIAASVMQQLRLSKLPFFLHMRCGFRILHIVQSPDVIILPALFPRFLMKLIADITFFALFFWVCFHLFLEFCLHEDCYIP